MNKAKKTNTGKQKPPKTRTREIGPRIVDGDPYLHEVDFHQLEAIHNKIALRREGATVRQKEIELLILRAETRKRQLATEVSTLDDQRRALEQDLGALKANLSKKYGVDFGKVFYDDETGKMTVVEDQESKT